MTDDATPDEIDVATFASLRTDSTVVLDVRELDEWQEVRIPGVLHIPLTELVERVAEIPADDHVYVVCAKGGRSRNACDWLSGRGVTTTNVDGGTDGWVSAGHPVERGS